MQRRNVLLPEPLEPMMLMTSPARACRETPRRTSLSPKVLWMSSTVSLYRIVSFRIRTRGADQCARGARWASQRASSRRKLQISVNAMAA